MLVSLANKTGIALVFIPASTSKSFMYKGPIWGFQESVLATIRPRNLVYGLLEILLLSRHTFMLMVWLFLVLKCM